ncbi:MAG TPA: HNH endonuclease signature motif containing protein [Patescibacteria group bacterium]
MKKRSWSENDLKKAAKKSTSIRQVLRCLGLKLAGGNYTQISKYIIEYKIDISHFTGKASNKGRKFNRKPKIELTEILKENNFFQSYKLKKRLISAGLKLENCEECGWDKRSEDGRLPLELHHVNGNCRDNRLENLQILCPNCHSLKSSHRGRNIGK